MSIRIANVLQTRHRSEPVRQLSQCGLALQVAVVEWDQTDISEDVGFAAFEAILKEAQKALKQLKKDHA